MPDPVNIRLGDFIDNIETQSWHRLAKLSWMPFDEARKFAHSLNLNSWEDWRKYGKGNMAGRPPRPPDIPYRPDQIYGDKGWLSWGDWLGTGAIASRLRQYRSFEKARAFVRSLKLRNNEEWLAYCKGEVPDKPPIPNDIPKNPNQTYAGKGWASIGDWLGTGVISMRFRKYRPFKQARAFARSLNLRGRDEWASYCKGEMPDKPQMLENVPSAADRVYKDKGWYGWGDWLGTGVIASHLIKYRSFKDARDFARSLNLRSRSKWQSYCKGEMSDKPPKPDDIPNNPNQTYAGKGWVGVGDWLGTGTIRTQDRKYRPFKQARAFARSLELKTSHEWRTFCKGEEQDKPTKPDDIPVAVESVYIGKGWISWPDWLGTD